jgi:hypothetical protein
MELFKERTITERNTLPISDIGLPFRNRLCCCNRFELNLWAEEENYMAPLIT